MIAIALSKKINDTERSIKNKKKVNKKKTTFSICSTNYHGGIVATDDDISGTSDVVSGVVTLALVGVALINDVDARVGISVARIVVRSDVGVFVVVSVVSVVVIVSVAVASVVPTAVVAVDVDDDIVEPAVADVVDIVVVFVVVGERVGVVAAVVVVVVVVVVEVVVGAT